MRNIMRGKGWHAPSLSRRRLLVFGAGASMFALAGCASSGTTTTTPNVSGWVTALQALAAEAGQIIPQLSQVAGFSSVEPQVQQIVAGIQQALSGVSSAWTQSQGQSALTTVENYINDLAPIVLPFVGMIPGVGTAGSVIGLIVASLPAIEAALNVALSALTPQATSLQQTAPPLPASARLGAAPPSASVSQQYVNLLISKVKAAKARLRK